MRPIVPDRILLLNAVAKAHDNQAAAAPASLQVLGERGWAGPVVFQWTTTRSTGTSTMDLALTASLDGGTTYSTWKSFTQLAAAGSEELVDVDIPGHASYKWTPAHGSNTHAEHTLYVAGNRSPHIKPFNRTILAASTPFTDAEDGGVNDYSLNRLSKIKWVGKTGLQVVAANTVSATDTLDITVKFSIDGGTTYLDLVTFTQITTTANALKFCTIPNNALLKLDANCGAGSSWTCGLYAGGQVWSGFGQ